MKTVTLGIKALLTIAFLTAGAAKLLGVEMMVATFETIGWGQWFRYLTAAIEIGATILLWLPRRAAIGAGLLVVTMIGAVIAHLVVLGPSLLPALVLGSLAAFIVWQSRDQLPARPI